jgi:hypothetical protein
MKTAIALIIIIILIVAAIGTVPILVVMERERATLIETVMFTIDNEHNITGTNYSIILKNISENKATIEIYENSEYILTRDLALKETLKVDSIKIILMTYSSQSATFKIYKTE